RFPDNTDNTVFTRYDVFRAASEGDAAQLNGLLEYLQDSKERLSSDFIDESNGKTALIKALLKLKDGKNDTIEVLIDIAEKTEDLYSFINAAYTDDCYKGQTALHVAIERRAFDYVKLLVEKGADVQAKASGTFFQRNLKLGFYFGELPLSLAACTNQPEIVSFLMENPYRKADPTDKDTQGNTVLHTLVVIADNTPENTEIVASMYDKILVQHYKLNKDSNVQLESIENNNGLTPLKLAAKLGKIGLFRHILNREFTDKETWRLSRKFIEWVYGPVHSSLYDTTFIDTNEDNSVLEIIIYGKDVPNRPEMLKIEPLHSLLQDKWNGFGSRFFLVRFIFYLMYLAIFTIVTFYRKDGKVLENTPEDHLRCMGEIISVLGAVWFLYKNITTFKKNPPNLSNLFTDGFSEILFFLQAILLLVCVILYFCGRREYVGLLVLSLALAWMNVLYYTRGSKELGIYNVMMQRMILGDLLRFLSVYMILLFGFSAGNTTKYKYLQTYSDCVSCRLWLLSNMVYFFPSVAVCALMKDSPEDERNKNLGLGSSIVVNATECSKPSYNDIRFTILEMFKFTIGMGDLQFADNVEYMAVFYILLISYIVLTYILMLNMLIALMGFTVERLSGQSETIWNLQRASTILDMERTLPQCLRSKLYSGLLDVFGLVSTVV
uniref:Transient receptor potential cation channel subfamily V member 1-like n=1 Tax=Cyprinodon variegatus TaxID=28743 RepID=A0A3Q2DCU8_CYPVA